MFSGELFKVPSSGSISSCQPKMEKYELATHTVKVRRTGTLSEVLAIWDLQGIIYTEDLVLLCQSQFSRCVRYMHIYLALYLLQCSGTWYPYLQAHKLWLLCEMHQICFLVQKTDWEQNNQISHSSFVIWFIASFWYCCHWHQNSDEQPVWSGSLSTWLFEFNNSTMQKGNHFIKVKCSIIQILFLNDNKP